MTIVEYINQLNSLGKEYGIQWTIGSGELKDMNYGGIAHIKGSRIWENEEAWFFSDDIHEVLACMLTSINAQLKTYIPRNGTEVNP